MGCYQVDNGQLQSFFIVYWYGKQKIELTIVHLVTAHFKDFQLKVFDFLLGIVRVRVGGKKPLLCNKEQTSTEKKSVSKPKASVFKDKQQLHLVGLHYILKYPSCMSIYCARALITRGLYIFYPIFQCSLLLYRSWAYNLRFIIKSRL